MEDIEELRTALEKDPFNRALRRTFAAALFEEGDSEEALTQCRILLSAGEEPAATYLTAARAALSRDLRDEALELYTKAKALPDFAPEPELSEAFEQPAPAKALRLIQGGQREIDPSIVYLVPPKDQIRFSDIAGMEALKKSLRLKIVEPFLNPSLFARFKKSAGGGVLLYGAPGCGKTMMARAIAAEIDAQFISVDISDVLNMYIGESERNLALIFERARSERPCVLFFDELDALAFSRSKARSEYTRTVVNEFLRQLDGVDSDNSRILFLAASNMPWDIDGAMRRPGRFAESVFVAPPDQEARKAIFALKLRGVPHGELDLDRLARITPHFSGADIDGVIDRAKEAAIVRTVESGNDSAIELEDLVAIIGETEPSTLEWLRTAQNLVKYGGGSKAYKEVAAYLKKEKIPA